MQKTSDSDINGVVKIANSEAAKLGETMSAFT